MKLLFLSSLLALFALELRCDGVMVRCNKTPFLWNFLMTPNQKGLFLSHSCHLNHKGNINQLEMRLNGYNEEDSIVVKGSHFHLPTAYHLNPILTDSNDNPYSNHHQYTFKKHLSEKYRFVTFCTHHSCSSHYLVTNEIRFYLSEGDDCSFGNLLRFYTPENQLQTQFNLCLHQTKRSRSKFIGLFVFKNSNTRTNQTHLLYFLHTDPSPKYFQFLISRKTLFGHTEEKIYNFYPHKTFTFPHLQLRDKQDKSITINVTNLSMLKNYPGIEDLIINTGIKSDSILTPDTAKTSSDIKTSSTDTKASINAAEKTPTSDTVANTEKRVDKYEDVIGEYPTRERAALYKNEKVKYSIDTREEGYRIYQHLSKSDQVVMFSLHHLEAPSYNFQIRFGKNAEKEMEEFVKYWRLKLPGDGHNDAEDIEPSMYLSYFADYSVSYSKGLSSNSDEVEKEDMAVWEKLNDFTMEMDRHLLMKQVIRWGIFGLAVFILMTAFLYFWLKRVVTKHVLEHGLPLVNEREVRNNL